MPKAPVNENNRFVATENEIWAAGELFPMQAITQT